jgi:Fic family protein
MLLLKKGYAYVPYSSVESIIESGKEGYYRSLRRTQKNIRKGKVDYEPWLSYFLTTLQKQKRHLEEKIAAITSDDSKLSRNQRTILALFDRKSEWTSAEISAELEINIETAKKSLQALTAYGYLAKQGATKGAWYERAKVI